MAQRISETNRLTHLQITYSVKQGLRGGGGM